MALQLNISFYRKQNETVRVTIIRDIRILYDKEKVYYYKPARVGLFFNESYIEYESNGDENKILHCTKTEVFH